MKQYPLIMKKLVLLLFKLNVTFLFDQKEISGAVVDNVGVAISGVNSTERTDSNGTNHF